MAQSGLQKEFSRIQNDYKKNDLIRDQIITLSRDILKPSKQAIYALHRNEIKKARQLLLQAKKQRSKVRALLKRYDAKEVGAYAAALEEYVEAQCYLSFIESGSFPLTKELEVPADIYLAGLCDCSGELARRALKLATEKEFKEVERISIALEELMGLFLTIDFRGIDMRKKIEGLKYNLSKTQDILYDIQMKGK
ncbi:MAG: hypothetical protein KC535_00445 [Nanoarchaeota archaeon]|nr:hypothetical protein [Nanoarchaeota archaeon]